MDTFTHILLLVHASERRIALANNKTASHQFKAVKSSARTICKSARGRRTRARGHQISQMASACNKPTATPRGRQHVHTACPPGHLRSCPPDPKTKRACYARRNAHAHHYATTQHNTPARTHSRRSASIAPTRGALARRMQAVRSVC